MTTATPISIKNGTTHTGDDPLVMQAALEACVVHIMSDPEWAVEVVLAAVLADHELRRGVDRKVVMRTLGEALSADFG